MNRFLAALLAPLATTIAIAMAFSGSYALRLNGLSTDDLRELALGILLVVVFATPIAYAIALFAGLPLALWLERRGRVALRDFVLLGAALGAAPFLLFDCYVVVHEAGNHLPSMRDVMKAGLWLALAVWCGTAVSTTYWYLTLRNGSSSSTSESAGHVALPADSSLDR